MLKAEEIIAGIYKLHPEAEFVFEGNDYSTIRWDVIDGTAPTLKEIEVAYAAHVKDEKATTAAKAAKKQEVLTKLGLSAEEVTALLA
jgi:hypothetical protein